MKWLFLSCAIIAEVIATSSLKPSQGFTRLVPSIIVIIGYGCAFYFMSLTLRYLPIAIVYALWSGFGIVLLTLAGWLVFKQKLDIPAIIGIALIMGGAVVMNLFSKSVPH